MFKEKVIIPFRPQRGRKCLKNSPLTLDEIADDNGKKRGYETSIYFYHPDHLGTNTLITDLHGDPYQFFVNLPYGETMIEQSNIVDYDNPFKFNGKELDTETGLYYYGARYYDPKLSGWLSVDPLAEKYPSSSPFIFVGNNPIAFIDPDGREIKVARSTQENGRPIIKISFSAEIVNNSKKQLSQDQVGNLRDQIASQIKESYGGSYKDFDVEVTTDIQVRESFNDVIGDVGHVISIEDSDHPMLKDDGDIGGTQRISSKYGNIAISSDIIDNEKQVMRTGAHEFGHAAGLNHPNDKNASKVDIDAGKDPLNLMHQSKRSSGTNIEQGQIEQIEKVN